MLLRSRQACLRPSLRPRHAAVARPLSSAKLRQNTAAGMPASLLCQASPDSSTSTSTSPSGNSPMATDAFQRLQGLTVLRATDGAPVQLLQQWGGSERVLVAWTRSLGCPFCQELAIQLSRDVMPKLQALQTRLLMVSIGTHERSKDFVARTGFPPEALFLDPDNITYDALGLKRNLQDTFFNISTPLSLLKRAAEGNTQDLRTALDGWQPWMTPRGPYQAMQQGGMFLFEGDRLVWSYLDKATGDHADLAEVLTLAQSMATKDCGCDAAATADVA